MKKLLILALASAFVAAANADNPNQFGVASTGLSNAEWKQDNQPVERAYTSGAIGIDEEASSPLVLSPTTGFTAPDPQVKTVVTVEATFTAISDYSSLAQLDEDAKTAFTVANVSGTPRYRYWNGSGWAALDDTVTAVTNSAITIKIELDNSTPDKTEAAFKVNDTQIGQTKTISSDTETTLSALAFAGTGTLTSVDATVTPAYATTETKRYASVSAAFDDNVAVADMTLRKYNGSFGTMPTDPNKLYFPASVNGNTASLYSFTKSGDDYQITSAADLKALVDLTAYDNTAHSFTQTVNIALTEAWPGIGIQNGKDLATGNATEKGKFDAGAFKGTYDGGNHTVSDFQMVDGLDYCGFFNSVSNATIRNLKISYKDGGLFAKDMAASNNVCGATFVGVAKGSTLQGLTSLAGTVSCTKGFGGIVGYLMGGSVVDSCTNNVNLTSLAPNKCGGIAMITQNGSGNAVIRNCQNNGTTTGSAEHGGLVGYVQQPLTIDGCESTVSDQLFNHYDGAVTVQGVNKAKADNVSYIVHSGRTLDPVAGLNFATVDGNVATFFADNALAAGNTYKVMAAGATATYEFTAAGTIAFDTALLATPPTYAITAGNGLVLTNSTEGTVKTYTARALATPTVTVNGGANATAAWTVNGESVASAPATLTEGDTYSVTYTPNSGYEFADGATTSASGTAGTENIVITISDAVEVTQIEIDSTATTTLVAVPADCKAAELIDLSNRAEGDVLKVYSKDDSDKCYYTWTLSGEKEWTPATTYKVSEASATSHEKAASAVQLYAGQAAWLTRVNPNEAIKLAVVAEGDTIPASVEKGWNMIAPAPKAGATTVDLNEVVPAGSATDQIKIPTAGAPITCTYENGEWGYYKFIKNDKGRVTRKEWVSDVTIDAGTGFWYISDSEKTVNLK